MRLQEQIDHQPLDGDRIVTDLAERDGEHPLADQSHHPMLDQVLAPLIVETSGKVTRTSTTTTSCATIR
jgi:hypothetical protein